MKHKINLVLIGSQKSGTTTLHEMLSKHSQIHMSSPLKEPLFFFPDEELIRYWERHNIKIESREQFFKRFVLRGFKNQKVIGESSTTYTISNTSSKYNLPKTIFDYNSNMKLIYIIRNPLSRILSHYRHLLKTKRVANWENYLASEKWLNEGIETSMYYRQLSKWIEYFDLSSIKVIFFEDFIKYPQNCLIKLCDFLEVVHEDIINYEAKNISPDQSDLYFSDESYQRLFIIFQQDCEKLSKLIGVNVFEKWNLEKELWVN